MTLGRADESAAGRFGCKLHQGDSCTRLIGHVIGQPVVRENKFDGPTGVTSSQRLALSNYKVFISYRRADTWGWAGRIYDQLCEKFGEERIFMDVEEIKPGEQFVALILDVVSHSDVALVIIGPRWLSEVSPAGGRRIDQSDDLVKLEVAQAFSNRVTVVPLLVEGTSMPLKEALPAQISALAALNAFELHPKTFRRDAAALCEEIQSILDQADRKRSRSLKDEIEDLERQKAEIDAALEAKKAEARAQVVAVDREFQAELAQGMPTYDAKGVLERPYAAFLLYSHAHDARLAAAIQEGLQRFAKPWYRLRSMRVFRDATNLAATPDLWNAITAGLERSKYVVLLASQSAAKSLWVKSELSYWIRNRSTEEILLVLSDGEIVWDNQTNDFDWSRTTALPPILRGTFSSEPLYVDMRTCRSADEYSLSDPRFHDAVGTLAAAVLQIPKDELVDVETTQLRRTRRLAFAAISLFLLLSTLSVTLVVWMLRLKGRG